MSFFCKTIPDVRTIFMVPKIQTMITKIGTVGVYVEDQEKALKFWTEKVGFVEKDRKDMGNGSFWLEVAPPNAESALVLYPKGLMPDFPELKPSIVFMCEDIDAFCSGLKQKGVRFEKELMSLGWGKFASFLDEDGNKYGLKG
jgi:lactoylglutathione lyase